MKKLFFIFFLIRCSFLYGSDICLFKDGKSDYTIVIRKNASESEKTAAIEFQSYIKAVSLVNLKIDSVATNKNIFIGCSDSALENKYDEDGDNYCYYVKGNDLYFSGEGSRGTMYGVFAFLEEQLGIKWYTAEYTKIPQIKTLYLLRNLKVQSKPSIAHRLDFYYDALISPAWCAHNRLNESYNSVRNQYGGLTKFDGMHTFFKYVSPEKYFKTHPEYFSLIDGKRIKDGQLCLSNKKMRLVLIENLRKYIRENPDAWVYDVSQMDNDRYCRCTNCLAIAKKYGGQSGLMLWFVNQVAKEISKSYPNKKIGMLAYHYTIDVPRNVRASDNVVVRLSAIDCCFSHSVNSNCPYNKRFNEILNKWSSISKNMYIWDYVVGFYQYLAPFPNFRALADNIRCYEKNNCVGILEEGVHEAPWGEFSEMRQWVIAKLLWNDKQNVDSLAKVFIKDYYGEAAPDIEKFYYLTQSLSDGSNHVLFSINAKSNIFTEEYISKGLNFIESGLKKVKRDKFRVRMVKRLMAQMYYLRVAKNYKKSLSDGTLKKLREILKEDPTNVMESEPDIDNFLKKQNYL